MATQTRAILKTYFNTGDRPTEQEFFDLIESAVNLEDKTDVLQAIDIANDNSYVTPKSVKKIIDAHAIRKVNNIGPDSNGNVEVTSITGTINKSQVTGLQADLDSKVNSGNLKTINGQSIVGTGDIAISAGEATKILSIPSAVYTIPGTASPNAFPANCDTFTLQANKTYMFKGKYLIGNGIAHTISMGWTPVGVAVSSMEYVARTFHAALNGLTTGVSHIQISGTALKQLTVSTSLPTSTIEFEGVLRCTTGGSLIPIIGFSSSATTPLSVMKVGSYIEFTEIGSNTVQTIGTVG